MEVKYTIEKKRRGNWRPTLTWTITIPKWVSDLAPHPVTVESQSVKYSRYDDKADGGLEGESSEDYSFLELCCTWERDILKRQVYLPFRSNHDYSDVDDLFIEFIKACGDELKHAYGLEAFKQTKALKLEPKVKKLLAPWVARKEMLEKGEKSHEES